MKSKLDKNGEPVTIIEDGTIKTVGVPSRLLRPIYDTFTEGFDTIDLRQAKAMLADLSEGKA